MRALLPIFLFPLTISAQTLVSTVPQNRTGLLEEFTAVNCPICPQGHVVAENLLASNPGDLVVVGVHGGALAVPSAGQLDFRTSLGTSLWSHFGVNAQPLGLMNRTPYGGQLLLGRSNWAGALGSTLTTSSPVNIGAATQFDPGTRDLTIDVEAYYTDDGTGANDHLHVLLTESDIIGYQASGGANYSHQHVLRSYISPLWGDAIPTNTQGTLEQRSYTFNVPTAWDIDNCHVVAFVGEYQGEVLNAVEIGANNFSTVTPEETILSSLHLYPQPATDRLFITMPAAVGQLNWEIREVNGRVLSTGAVPNATSTTAVDLRGLANGVYMLLANGRAERFLVTR